MRTAMIAATAATLATLVTSQASTTVSQSMPPSATTGVDIARIEEKQRFQWCLAQQNNCPFICGGTTSTNTCEESDLSYSCICSNGTAPDVSAYQDTIPFYLCQETFAQCIEANPDDAEGQDACRNNQQCGSLNATAAGSSSSTSSSSTTSSTTTPSAADASESESAAPTASATPTGGASTLLPHVATGAFVALLTATFKLFL